MKKTLLGATALCLALTAASAFAADLPSKKAPPYIPPPPAVWTGFYAGLNIGGGFGTGDTQYGAEGPIGWTFVPPGALFLTPGAAWTEATNLSGVIGGGQVGYNYQFGAGGLGSWVVGLEADIQGAGLSSHSQGYGNVFLPASLGLAGGAGVGAALDSTSTRVDWYGTVRGRLGFLFTPTLLVYGTGGLAYGGVNTTVNHATLMVSFPLTSIGLAPGSASFSDTKVGWTAGGGLEWMFMPNWSAKVEYLYTDLGTSSISTFGVAPWITPTPFIAIGASSSTVATRWHTVRAGVNYHFNWGAPAPVLAKY
jgi:outer membrane immunogenic protein